MRLRPTSPTMPSKVPVERLFRASTTLHRSTQELSIQAAELEAALVRDGTARFRQALVDQQPVRIAGAIALAVAATLLRAANPVIVGAVSVIAGLYIGLILRAATLSGRPEASFTGISSFVAVLDATVVTALCALGAAGGNTDVLIWILVVGAVATPATAFAFAGPAAMLGVVLFAVGYLGIALLFVGLAIGTETAATAIATTAIWGTGVWLIAGHFSGVRDRLDWLRTYAKLAEIGEMGTSD